MRRRKRNVPRCVDRGTPEARDTTPKPRRFGSVEFIIVSVLLVGLAVYFAMAIWSAGHHARNGYVVVAIGQIKELEKAVRMYQLEADRLPVTLSELLAPVGVHEEGLMDDIPLDPWGHDYVYDPTGGTKNRYLILSLGEDGIIGTDDDFGTEHLPGQND
jgi:general secretion pathway protein G